MKSRRPSSLCDDRAAVGFVPVTSRRFLAAAVLALCALAVASMALAPALFPYHPRLQTLYLMTIPVTVGWTIGTVLPGWSRRRLPYILAGTAVVFSAALASRLQHNLPPLLLGFLFAAALIMTLAFTRIGLAHAGIGWDRRKSEHPGTLGPRTAFAILAVTWGLMLWAAFHPRETSPATRLLLWLTLGKPDKAEAAAVLRVRQQGVSDQPLTSMVAVYRSGDYRFDVGRVKALPGTVLATVSVRRQDDGPFARTMWLTIEAEDPRASRLSSRRPEPSRGLVDPRTVAAREAKASVGDRRLTSFVTFAAAQSPEQVRLRCRLWTLDDSRPSRMMAFRPVAEQELGVWDLTPYRWLRRQPVSLESTASPATK